MFWESLVSDNLLVEMYKTAIMNQIETEFVQVLQEEIIKRELPVDLPKNA